MNDHILMRVLNRLANLDEQFEALIGGMIVLFSEERHLHRAHKLHHKEGPTGDRLVGTENPQFEGRGHFFAAAAEAMRRILIDRARQKLSLKRGAGAARVNLEDLEVASAADDDTLLAVDEALTKLAREDPDSAEFIKLRFFAGMTNDEAAQALGIPERTARRHWSFARAWLFREIQRQAGT